MYIAHITAHSDAISAYSHSARCGPASDMRAD